MDHLNDIISQLGGVIGEVSVISYDNGSIYMDYWSGKNHAIISIDEDGWSVYTDKYGMIWEGSLTEAPPNSVYEKLHRYLS